MLDRWFSTIKLPISFTLFKRLPRNPAYKYEYFDNTAWLSPRPKFQRARLKLRVRQENLPLEVDGEEMICIRGSRDRDWPRLTRPFARAFDQVQPFASLSERRQLIASRECLKFTREGGDGPMIVPACHVAVGKERRNLLGAILVTLTPAIDLDGFGSLRWKNPPPADCIERQLGRPHLTWIFVNPWYAYHGIGTSMLAHAERNLLALGYTELISSFIWGNTSSMLWHWRKRLRALALLRLIEKFPEADAKARESRRQLREVLTRPILRRAGLPLSRRNVQT